jgi:hypothetical protein
MLHTCIPYIKGTYLNLQHVHALSLQDGQCLHMTNGTDHFAVPMSLPVHVAHKEHAYSHPADELATAPAVCLKGDQEVG